MSEQRMRASSPAVLAAWAFPAACLYLIVSMNRTINVYDEGIILTGAARVLAGGLPHRDFYANYGPGQFYILALLFKLFGASVLIERGWDIAVRASIVSLVLLLAGRMALRRRTAVLAACACCIWLGLLGFPGYPVFPALAAALASQAFLMNSWEAERPAPVLLGAGACMGVAALFRYDVGVAGLACAWASVAAAWWLGADGTERRPRALLLACAMAGAGFGVVTVPLFVGYAAFGVIPGFVFDIFTYPVQFYARMRALPFPTFGSLAAAPANLVIYFPVMVGIAACPALLGWLRAMWHLPPGPQRQVAAERLADLLSVGLLGIAFFVKGSIRVSQIHMAMALVVSLVLLAGLARPFPKRGLPARCLAAAAVALAAGYTFLALGAGTLRAAQNLDWAMQLATWAAPAPATWPPAPDGTCHPPPDLQPLRCFRVAPDLARTIRYVHQHTRPGDPVFVGLPRHDMIVTNDVLLYFALQLPPATRWYHFDPGLQTSRPIQQEMVADLQRARPAYVVIVTWPATPPEPNGSSISSGVTLLDAYLRRSYEPVARFGEFSIMAQR
jgi:hypothetical protein